MTIRLVVSESIEKEVRAHLLEAAPLEKGAALLLGSGRVEGGVALYVRELIPAPPNGFRLQGRAQWAPATSWLSELVGAADEKNGGLALIHSHPMTSAAHRSAADKWADEIVAPYFVDNLPGRPFGSLVLTSHEINGSAWIDGVETRIDEIRIVGSVMRTVVRSEGSPRETHRDAFLHDRQESLFGTEGQQRLSALTVGIVGVGGTGSAVAEQIVRMGVGRVLIVDNDILEVSNISRVYGSHMDDVGVPKVDVAAKSLRAIGSSTLITPLRGDIREEQVVKEVIRHCDVVFGCTDSHSSRAVLNDVAYQYMLPVIDMGVRVGIGRDGPTGAPIEIRTLRPGLPCLWCYGAIDGRRVAEELMEPGRREALEKEGYVQRGQPAATIIPYTTLAAALATSRFLGLATGITDIEPGVYVFDAIAFEGWTAKPTSSNCVCRARTGLGDARPVWMRDAQGQP